MKSLLKLGLLIATFLCLSASMASAKVIGSLTHVEPVVDALHSGETRFTPLSVGNSVFLKDVVRTKRNGKAEIELTNGNCLSLAPFTRVDMEEYLEVKERTGAIKLSRGKVRVITPKKFRIIPVAFRKEPALEVHTPTAVVGIRGSDAFVFHQGGISGVIVSKGKGYTYSVNFPEVVQEISAGEAVFITGYTPAPPPRPVSKFEMAVHAKDTSPTEEGEVPTEEGTPEWSGSPESSEYTETLETKPEIAAPEKQERMVPTTEITTVETTAILPITETQKEQTVETTTAAAVISGTLSDGLFYYYSGGSMNSQGSLSGGLSGTSGDWTDGWNSVSFSGDFSNATGIGLMKMEGTATGSSGNFEGYVGGIGIEGGTWKGRALNIYIDPNQNAGYLINDGDVSGTSSGTSWTGTGNLTLVQMNSSIGVAPGDLSSSLLWDNSYSNIVDYCGLSYFSGSFTGGGSLLAYAASGYEWSLNVSGVDWGAWMMKYGGTVSGTTSDTWILYFYNSSGNATPWDSDTYVYANVEGTKWSGNELTGTTRGYWYDLSKVDCGIAYGETIGTYSAASATTFQALTHGYWIDASTYWNKLDSGDTTTLAALNIPVTEVYSQSTLNNICDLSVCTSSFLYQGGGGSATMNIKWLGATSGASYGLWSAEFNGTYGSGAVDAWKLHITNGSASANIRGEQWSGGQFLGEVWQGSATLNSDTVSFKGAVGGSLPTGSTFSGHGAGRWEK